MIGASYFGFTDYSLIAYHFIKGADCLAEFGPVFYALAMGAGGPGSLIFSKLFDRIGLFVLAPVTIVVAAYAPLSFLGGFTLALIGALLCTRTMSTRRAAVLPKHLWV